MRRSRKKESKYKLFMWLAIVVLIVGLGYSQTLRVDASARPSASEIPDGTLIIGTHLIALQALNQEILEIAIKSADDMKTREDGVVQDRVYYKSDLNQGVWYDITNAESVTDISISTSKAVSNELIDSLILTHWTKSDGITIELATGRAVSVQDIESMEDPKNLPELAMLKIEKEVQEGKLQALEETAADSDDEDRDLQRQIEQTKEKIDSIDRVFAPIEDTEIDALRQILDHFDGFIQYLINDKQAPDRLLNIAAEEKKITRAIRDTKIYEAMLERLYDELEIAIMLEDGELISRYGSTIDELRQSFSEAEIDADRGEPTTALEKIYQQLAEQLATQVQAGDYPGGYDTLLKMQGIDSILNNRILDRKLELELIEQAMDMVGATLELLTTDAGDEYKAAKDNGESEAVLNRLRNQRASDLQRKLQEIDDLLEYKKFRTDPGLHAGLIEDMLKHLRNLEDELASIPTGTAGIDDDMKAGLTSTIQESTQSLAQDLAKAKAANSPEIAKQTAELERLQKLEDDIQEQYYRAAEIGDLEALEKIKAQLDSLKALVEAEQNQAAANYKNLLDQKSNLEEQLQSATTDIDKSRLRSELDGVLLQMAGLENQIDGKALQSLQQLDDLKSDLKDALQNDEMRMAGIVAADLVDLLAIIPEEIMSEQQKDKELAAVLKQLQDKADQYEKLGNSGAADALLTTADRIEERAADKGLGESRPTITLPPVSPYSIVFTDFNINVREPLIYRNDTVYIASRQILELLGAKVTWQAEQQRIIAQDPRYSMLIEYSLNQDVIYVNNRRVRLQHPMESKNGQTYIPLQVLLDAYRMTSETRDGVIYARMR
ncbi:stalk domain-containing protein [Desulfuribacillus alkaliarsenatis]|uniref:Copper amine oxidase-like N-terminal domain-containing protein n=1 Tax=Desulfuribacillus alkaliarsenatis TaxID=766136 RepID=A0A1E5G2D5_9FIRM|nr:stalk domain-containing protein [Desulfuribacillus alkaliarsenatis]OEF97126.1 hypothetical protein BHF68_05890 [Desulfuribacillus alkaliarsenatis]